MTMLPSSVHSAILNVKTLYALAIILILLHWLLFSQFLREYDGKVLTMSPHHLVSSSPSKLHLSAIQDHDIRQPLSELNELTSHEALLVKDNQKHKQQKSARRVERALPPPKKLPPKRIYFITPTYDRLNQRAELIRLSNTLKHVDNLLWIVVEDATTPSDHLRHYLKSTGIPHVLLATKTHRNNPQNHRGLLQRNLALNYIEKLLVSEKACYFQSDRNVTSHLEHAGVIYFGDDDNAYDLRLFEALRKVKRFSLFSVGLITGIKAIGFEGPIIQGNSIVGFNSNFKSRVYSIDMAGFAFSTDELCRHRFTLRFNKGWRKGKLEDKFLLKISRNFRTAEVITKDVLAFHTKSLKNLDVKSYNPWWNGEMTPTVPTSHSKPTTTNTATTAKNQPTKK